MAKLAFVLVLCNCSVANSFQWAHSRIWVRKRNHVIENKKLALMYLFNFSIDLVSYRNTGVTLTSLLRGNVATLRVGLYHHEYQKWWQPWRLFLCFVPKTHDSAYFFIRDRGLAHKIKYQRLLPSYCEGRATAVSSSCQ